MTLRSGSVAANSAATFYTTPGMSLGSGIVNANTTLTSLSPYRTICNSASAITVTLPTSPVVDETRVVSNVGAGTATISYTGRGGASTRPLAQDSAVTFAWNATLAYWTTE